MARPQKTNVGVIGLGIIGQRAAANLRRAGFQVWVWSRTPRPEPNFLPSPREVAESAQIIEIYVSDGAALAETITAMLPALTPAHTVVNHATVSPAETKEAARLVTDRHAKFLDAPFTGSRDAAAAAGLVFFIGGDPETLAGVRPVLEANAKSILEVGAIGDATAIKIATNLIAAVSVSAYAEALALLAKSGVGIEKLPVALESHAVRSGIADMKVPAMILGDFEPRFSLKHMFKDIQIALSMASEAGLDLPAASAFAGEAMSGLNQGWADKDFSSIAGLFGYPNPDAPLDERFRPAQPAQAPSENQQPQKRWGLFGGRAKP